MLLIVNLCIAWYLMGSLVINLVTLVTPTTPCHDMVARLHHLEEIILVPVRKMLRPHPLMPRPHLAMPQLFPLFPLFPPQSNFAILAWPELWFAQVEAQSVCRKITCQRSRFNHIVSHSLLNNAAEVKDLLIKPPADSPYTTLMMQLTKCTTASEQRKLHLLFTFEELGDRKPTQLLRRMQQLLGDHTASLF